jgi:demethylmenaquinone methyltransferase/2-methoxy-6-polyprenyl-1,4-benzoquinol methylase
VSFAKQKAIRILKKENPHRILDVATGTGDFALEAVSMKMHDVQITGVDISAGMIEVGKKKVARKKLEHAITLQIADSENLPFDTGHFDAFTVAFGVRHFQDLRKGMSEMLRVLKPGGMGVIVEFSRPNRFPIKQLFTFYFKYVMPTIGKLVSKDARAYTYLPESVDAFPSGKDFLKVMTELGYQEVKCIPLSGGIASIYIGKK